MTFVSEQEPWQTEPPNGPRSHSQSVYGLGSLQHKTLVSGFVHASPPSPKMLVEILSGLLSGHSSEEEQDVDQARLMVSFQHEMGHWTMELTALLL